ncbi:MAG: beta-propeller fold lactonase family protein [Solirubrobacterales bacterium]|nr:beta-propeller fold lactonase family protein [Solirubrobacterales bacterium]
MHHLPRRWPRTMLAGLLTLVGAVATPAVAAAHESHGGYVYVNDNTAGTNTVAAFARQGDGRLTPVAGSPFSAGGAGSGSGLASQGAIQVTSDGRYVLAVDAGSNQIATLRIEHDGALELVRDGLVSSGGVQPVSVAEHHGIVYVANAGAGGTNYTGFRLSDGGRLRPLAGSTVPLPDNASPATCCSTQPARTWWERESAPHRSTASAWAPTAGSPPPRTRR